MRTDTQKALCKLLKGDYRNESSLELVRRVEGLVEALRRERDALKRGNNHENEAVSQLSEITKMLVESSMMRRNINSSVQALIEIATTPDTTQPQLSEIRYVLHGDIQPCSVLYSDDTTTLLRLDEGDMMLETDTIEWSDSVTYRCQELLKSSGLNKINLVRVSGHLAQLVRDERILLNDDGDDEAVEANPNAETLEAVGEVFVEALSPYVKAHDTRTEER